MQLKLPIETGVFIEKAAPVRLVNAVVERMDIRNITRSYSRMGRIEYPPRVLLKILLLWMLSATTLPIMTRGIWLWL